MESEKIVKLLKISIITLIIAIIIIIILLLKSAKYSDIDSKNNTNQYLPNIDQNENNTYNNVQPLVNETDDIIDNILNNDYQENRSGQADLASGEIGSPATPLESNYTEGSSSGQADLASGEIGSPATPPESTPANE